MKKWPIIVIVIFVLAALAGSFLKKSGGDRCALDGMRIEPVYQVDVTPAEGKTLKFCCIECARKWMAAYKGNVGAVTVTDEVTGNRIDASIAHFVESSIVTNPSTGNRIHVFAERADAEKHAEEFGGTVIGNPFAAK
jgi:nitrous oxide reductase accessory protein NosL